MSYNPEDAAESDKLNLGKEKESDFIETPDLASTLNFESGLNPAEALMQKEKAELIEKINELEFRIKDLAPEDGLRQLREKEIAQLKSELADYGQAEDVAA